MLRAFPFAVSAERGRNKERLEASLAGLCELELLKQRQESLVLSALTLGNRETGPGQRETAHNDLTLRRHLNSLQCNPWGVMAALEQQVGELRVDTETCSAEANADLADSRPSSGFYELSEGQSPAGLSESSSCVFGEVSPGNSRTVRVACAGDRPKSVGENFVGNQEGLQESAQRPTVPRSFSAPYPSLEGIAEGEVEDDPWLWDPKYTADVDGEPTLEDYKQAQRVENYIMGLIHRRAQPLRPCKPRTSLGPDSRGGVVRQSSLNRKESTFSPELRNVSSSLEGQSWACRSYDEQHYRVAALTSDEIPALYSRATFTSARSVSLDYSSGTVDPTNSDPDSPQHFQAYPTPNSPPLDDQLVNAQYIPAQPCRTPTRALTHRPSVHPKTTRQDSYSPEPPILPPKAKATSKKCRFNEERPSSRKPGRRACRSQSENSLLGQRGTPERKYNTVDRDGSRGSQVKTRRPQSGTTAGYRRWRSTLELSQDECELPGEQVSRRSRKHRPPAQHYPYSQGGPHGHYHTEYLEHTHVCRPDDRYTQPIPGESESSFSEADSPGSSSLSSDSDESGGLVWPQQLPPHLAPPSPPSPPGAPTQPKAFVKIKASHALKKKILRFRTGSLKVMTTV